MNITKKILGQLDRVYAVTIMPYKNKLYYLAASEGQGACLMYDEEGNVSTVWEGPGGTMNIVLIPGREGEFIATQQFFPTFNAKESKIVYGKINEDLTFTIEEIMCIPYLHRFDIVDVAGELWFVGATLCEDKAFQDDWSKPGKVQVAKLDNDLSRPFELEPILQGITKNHGFCHGAWKGKEAIMISGVEGLFVIYVPSTEGASWQVEQIIRHEVSDMAVCDIDGDGELEIATIEGFHGPKGVIYKEVDGILKEIHTHEYEFGHVVWGGDINNVPAFIIGGRKGKMELIVYTQDEADNIAEQIIDNTGGASNIDVYQWKNEVFVLAANRQIGEIALYSFKKG